MGGRVELDSGGRTASAYLAAPDMGAGPALIVMEEWWRVVGHIEDVCDRFAAEGFTALAPELSTATPDEAGQRMMALNLEQAAEDLDGAIRFLGASDAVRGQGVGVTGFGLGGALALELAVRRQDDVRACVLFYGAIPESPAPDWSKLEAPVQGHFAERDASLPPERVGALEEALHGLGKDVQFFSYPAEHAFFDDTRADVHDPESARMAWIRTLDFLRSKLG